MLHYSDKQLPSGGCFFVAKNIKCVNFAIREGMNISIN